MDTDVVVVVNRQVVAKSGYKINEAPKPQKINRSKSTKHRSLRRFEFKTVSSDSAVVSR